MDRGVLHKSSALVGEMGEGHGWWSVNNLRPPFVEQLHNPASLFLPSSTTTSTTPSSSSSPLHSFSSLLLSNHYPLPSTATTSTAAAPWHDTGSRHGQHLQDSWNHILLGGLASGEEGYNKNWEGQVLLPTTPAAAAAEADHGSNSYNNIYSTTTTSHGSSTSDDASQLAVAARPSSSPWGGIHGHHPHHNALQQQASSPRSSCITSTTSLGSNGVLEFSNNTSPRECISTASGAAFKKARTQEPSPAQATVKVRKEKLGDRITALHQLVSPFGKTDTASVLLEAIGYIRFLHGQIEALSSPYLGNGGSSSNGGGGSNSKLQHQPEASRVQGERNSIFPEDPGQLLHDNAVKKRGQPDQDESCEEAKTMDLRSRGLCLVPVSCTVDVGVDAGPADYWAAPPAFGIGFGR
ncbi:transcription factor bHLH133-like [Oryza glaberrima]|nr:transcription factor bHLH133-like [Oryza glaberrima]